MKSLLIATAVVAFALSQTSCGMLGYQANRAKHLLQWPFRAEVHPRHIDGVGDLERDVVEPRFA